MIVSHNQSNQIAPSQWKNVSVPVPDRSPAAVADHLREASEVAGDKWVLLALDALTSGPRRFGDLAAQLDGIAPNVLIDRLRRMEREGLVVSTLYSHRPRRFVYDLTESGRELAIVLPTLAAWARRRSGAEPLRHDVCGTPLETRLWCPGCRTTVDENGHGEDLRWV